jgi:hypothetical protein
MKKYEQKTVVISIYDFDKDEEKLNYLGKKGFKVVASNAFYGSTDIYIIMEREVEENKE